MAILNSYKVAVLLSSSCLLLTFFCIRTPQNVFQPLYEKQISNYSEHLPMSFIETNNSTEAKLVLGQSTEGKQSGIKFADYKVQKIINHKIANDSDALALEFNFRQDLVQRACADLGEQADQMNIDWDNGKKVRFIYLDKIKKARVCMHFKSGYSSWTTTARTLKKQKRKGGKKALLITVRHPLVRLLSAWKDKFIGGSPLFKFDEAWRKETKTKERWFTRWQRYWMLALVSTEKIEVPHSLKEAIKNKKKISDTIKSITLQDEHAATVKFPPGGMVAMNDYRNVSFTFADFLVHVIWSYDNGIPNIHWTPTIVQCDLCHLNYDYILHLEDSKQEVPYVLKNIGFDIKEFVTAHPSHETITNKTLPKSKIKTYIDYYNEVPKDIVHRIMELFDADFKLLGYPKEFT